jgi:hypothetical protein
VCQAHRIFALRLRVQLVNVRIQRCRPQYATYAVKQQKMAEKSFRVKAQIIKHIEKIIKNITKKVQKIFGS